MKKLVLHILCSIPILALAQPTINAVPSPIGDSLSFYEGSYPQNDFPTSGFNNWDFSDVSYNSQATPLVYLLPGDTPYATDFPTATFSMRFDSYSLGTYYEYYQQNSDSLYLLGQRYISNPQYDLDLPNPMTLFKFPFLINTSFVDSYSFDFGYQDSLKAKYVGWGSIKTPLANTYPDVFLFELYQFNTPTQTWELYSYNWVSAATLQSIFTAYVTTQDIQFFEKENNTSGITTEQLEEKFHFSLYPNPSNAVSFIDFDLPQKANVSIQLISVEGKTNSNLISENMESGNHHVPVNTSDLADGTYFMRLVIDHQVIVKLIEIVR